MPLLARGSAMLARRLGRAAGVGLVYARGGRTVVVTGWPGDETAAARAAGQLPVYVTAGETDWLVPAATLLAADWFGEPQTGDTLTTAGGTAYELRPRDAAPCWRWGDREPGDGPRLLYRLHTIPVGC